jgi:hypothetical protein
LDLQKLAVAANGPQRLQSIGQLIEAAQRLSAMPK